MVSEGFDLSDDIHTLDNTAEDDVAVIQPRGLHGGDEELGTVGVGTSVGHRHDARAGVPQDEVLILELVAIDGLATGSVVVLEITTLAHEVRNHTMECGTLVAKAFLSGAESAEVFASLWSYICAQLDNDTSQRLVIGGKVEKATRQTHGFFGVITHLLHKQRTSRNTRKRRFTCKSHKRLTTAAADGTLGEDSGGRCPSDECKCHGGS